MAHCILHTLLHTHTHFLLTDPNVAILVIWFPVPSCVTVEETVLRCPIRAAVATLRCYGAHLLSGTQVHL